MTLKRFETPLSLSSLVALSVVAALAGCASDVPLNNPSTVPVESRNTTGNTNPNASSGGTPESTVQPVDLTRGDGANAGGAGRTIYFDFDSFVVKDDFRPIIESQSKRLAADRKKHIAVEGHTDDRGGREYNLALGQKRAEAVAKSMTLLGVADNQVEAVSFGKERPAAQGNDEAAWAKNRRAEITDK